MDERISVGQRRGVPLAEQDWERVVNLIPLDLELSARTEKALQRRRKVRSGADLLRMVLGYALGDWSLRLTGAWGTLTGIAPMSDVAVLKRLRNCGGWLAKLVGALVRRRVRLTQRNVRLRLADGTVVSRPGSQGTDWRAHLSLNLESLSLDGIEITDAHGGETFARYAAQPGDVLVGDGGYAHPSSLGPVLAADGDVAVRIGWQNLRLEADGARVDIIRWLQKIGAGPAEREVWLDTPQGRFKLRLIARRIKQETADGIRRRLIRTARKKGRMVDARTLFAAGFVVLISSLPMGVWTAEQVMDLYRIRWQIEVGIKRLKSLMDLDQLRAQDPALAQVYLLAKMLGALVVDELTGQLASRCPAWFESVERPVSAWRVVALVYDGLRSWVRGTITFERILAALPDLGRYLRDSPRDRPQQWAVARNLLQALQAGMPG
ncbi:MAG: transposase [Anaerolineae bacterium]|nr:transposase [Anaerolineae bacterium]